MKRSYTLLGKGAIAIALAGALSVGGASAAFAAEKIANSSTPVDTPSYLLTTASVRAGSAGPDFLGITNTNYDFQPSHTAKFGDPYGYYGIVSGKATGWGANLGNADHFNRLAIWGTGVNENANPYYQNLLAAYLLDDDVTDNKDALPTGYTMATTYHSNKDIASWGDINLRDTTGSGIISQDVVFGANKLTNWNGDFKESTDTASRNPDALYVNNDSTNIWTQMYTISQMATAVDNATAAGGKYDGKITRYDNSNATVTAVNYERAIKGQMLYVASKLDAADGNVNGKIESGKKKVAYLYAIQDGTAYFFVPGTATNGSIAANADTSAGASGISQNEDGSWSVTAVGDTDYVSNNSTINMGYMATLPFVTDTFDSGNATQIVMKVEDIWKANPACTVTSADTNALADVDVIIYNSTTMTGNATASTDFTGSGGSGGIGTNNGRNSSGVYNTSKLTAAGIQNWASAQGLTLKSGVKFIAGDDYGTGTKQNAAATSSTGTDGAVITDSCPILYCGRNYTVDKDTRAAWIWSKVFPEYYDNNDDATYGYWLEEIYHIQKNQVANVLAQYTHQSTGTVNLYENNSAAITAKAEEGYSWYQGISNSGDTLKANYAYYTGATRASWYDAKGFITEQATHGEASASYTDAEIAAMAAESQIPAATVGIFQPSATWDSADHTGAQPTTEATALFVNGDTASYITESAINAAGEEVTKSYSGKSGSVSVTATFAKLTNLVSLPDDYCHLQLTAGDGVYTKFYPTAADTDDLYMYVENGAIRTAVDGSAGKKWCSGVTEIAVVSDHNYVDGICSYCQNEYVGLDMTDYTADFGTTVTFDASNVSGLGTATVSAYIWEFSSDEGQTWTKLGVTTEPTKSVVANQTNADRKWRVTAKTSDNRRIESNVFSLNVTVASISMPDVVANFGEDVQLSASDVTGIGTATVSAYIWEFSSDEGQTWTKLGATTAPTMTVKANWTNADRKWRVTAKTSDNRRIESNAFALTIRDITFSVADVTAPRGGTFTATVTDVENLGTARVSAYIWEFSSDEGQTWTKLGASTTPSMSVQANWTNAHRLWRVTLKVTNGLRLPDEFTMTLE